MKTTFISVMALGVAVAMGAPADRAAAGEPMVLSAEQLDRVTAGSHLRIGSGFDPDIGEFILRVQTPGITAVMKTAAPSSSGGGIFNDVGAVIILPSTITRHSPEWTDFNTHDPGQTN